MGVGTYKQFLDLYDVPYSVVTTLYAVTLLIFSSILAFSWCCKCKCDSFCERIEPVSAWMVRIIFGKSEGVSDGNSGKNSANLKDDKEIHINGRKLNAREVNILGTIITCFGLLVAITAYGTYLLEITHTCSEDTAIYCFPQLLNPNTSEITDLGVDQPITNCSEWTNSSIAPYITFQCFRYAYNANGALAVAGGLLALFTIVMRTTISILVKVFKFDCFSHCIALRYIVAYIIIYVDVAIAFIVMSFHVVNREESLALETLDNPVAQLAITYIVEHGVQFVISTGTVALLLLICWEEHAKTDIVGENQEAGTQTQETTSRV